MCKGLKDQLNALQQPSKDLSVRAAVEKELSRCLQRCEQLNKKWEFEVGVLSEDLKRLKADGELYTHLKLDAYTPQIRCIYTRN